MDEVTDRLALPLIAPGQAQKEMAVNEALTLLDMAAQATVLRMGLDVPPGAPEPGQCWIVGPAPSGSWAGRAGQVAGWTAGGWRFLAPREGWTVWIESDGCVARYLGGEWRALLPVAPIDSPAGGTTVDAEARDAIAAIVAALEQQGLALSV